LELSIRENNILTVVDVEEQTIKVLNNPEMDTNDNINLMSIKKDFAFVSSSSFR